ncbi:hypothetical protein [Spongiactinospora sp. TRM90649]|uniref:hypothetical protein n=1 Tax=Spongiactinospora sp. TRM90649 TaxID=3031114 RepID=UPI0023F70957|nr:hypothetical protein [Spongiactinospora sp. TRM90649]MDF5756623.1 hypothetical protein [Spongiactinospora sp. TRM90649]
MAGTPAKAKAQTARPDVKAVLSAILAWLTTREDGTARPEKGWQLLCEKNPTIGEAASYAATDGLGDKTRPGSGVIAAPQGDYPGDIVATYPDGRRIATRADDGAWRLGVPSESALATRVLQLAELRKLIDADDPQAKAAELATAAERKAAEARAKDLERDLREIVKRQKQGRPYGPFVTTLREEWPEAEIKAAIQRLGLALEI